MFHDFTPFLSAVKLQLNASELACEVTVTVTPTV